MTQRGTQAQPNIFSFHDYREFLKAQLQWLDQEVGGYSWRNTSLQAGLGESHLPQILRGTRNLSDPSKLKLFPLLKLSKRELSFLDLLCQLADGQDRESRLSAIAKMRRFAEYQEFHKENTESYQYMSKWYYVVIREMTYLPNFSIDPKWIQDRLLKKVSLSDVQKAVGFLINSGFIKIDSEGKVIKEDRHIDASGGIYKLVLGEFHRQMFQRATDAIEDTPRDQRLIDSNTFAVSNDQIPHIKEILSKAIDEVISYINHSPKEIDKSMVYHVAFTGFPLAKSEKKE